MTPFLITHVEGERFAFRTADLLEIVRVVAVTPLPGVPSVVEGVIDYRGDVIPVLNLRQRLAYARQPPNLSDRFIIAGTASRVLAIRVDAVDAVMEVEESEIAASEGLWSAGSHVAGVVRSEGGLVLFADLDSFLSQTEAQTLEQAMAAVLPATS